MPLIKLKHISSFSSEDTTQPSSNLLKPETYRKWRCSEPGEKQAVVVLELEKATKIHAVDIGNNGSALIEVLVGRSSEASDQYKVILVTSSFMSPAESKTFTNTSRVRMFGHDKLSKPASEEKWDKVKIVCSQPFNKNERYGLSFVSLHSPPEDPLTPSNSDECLPTPKRLGNFKLRDEVDDSFKPGSLFFQKKKTSSPMYSSTAAQVRDAAASSTATTSRSSVAESFFKSRLSVGSEPNEERERKPDKQDRPGKQESKQDKQDRPGKQESKPVKQDRPGKQESKPVKQEPTTASNKRKNVTVQEKANSLPPKKSKGELTENIPFNQILKSVVFVLSGFKNPERSDIRDLALEMGAQYKPDWITGCTHLICAFSNTPKYFQVKGKGKIVTKKWIVDSHKKKRKLPTKNFHLPGDTSSSEDLTDEEPTTSKWDTSPLETPPKSRIFKSEIKVAKEECPAKLSHQPEIDPYDEDTDDEVVMATERKETDSEQDTEDELNRIHQKDQQDDDDIYDRSTEDEDEDEDLENEESGSEGIPELPDFFSKKHFLLYGEMDQSLRRTLIRYITAYNGVVEDYMKDSVDFVITNETWDQNFEDALEENPSLAFIKPKWIFACHDKKAMVPFQPYIITPS